MNHVPGGVLSVLADDDAQLHCLLCNEIVAAADLMMLWRLANTSAWRAVCQICALEVVGRAIGVSVNFLD